MNEKTVPDHEVVLCQVVIAAEEGRQVEKVRERVLVTRLSVELEDCRYKEVAV